MDNSLEQRILFYLSAVDAAMGHVPHERREALRLELRDHIDRLVDRYAAAGKTAADAVDEALSMMGEPSRVGREYTSMWYRSTEPGSVLAGVGVIEVTRSVLSAIIRPCMMHHYPGPPFVPAAVLCLQFVTPAIMAGWMNPKGATKAAALTSALSLCVDFTLRLGLPHGAIENPSFLFVSALSLPTVLVAAVTTRVRMRRIAGI